MINHLNAINSHATAFKSVKKTDHGNNYYKSNVGIGIGSGIGLYHTINRLKTKNNDKLKSTLKDPSLTPEIKKFIFQIFGVKTEKELIDFAEKNLERNKKYAIPFALTVLGLSIGGGKYIDSVRNKKAKKNADLLATKDYKNLSLNKKIYLNDNNKPYIKNNEGLKKGTLLGTLFGVTSLMLTPQVAKKVPLISISTVISYTLGGVLVGSIYDKITNNNAKKHA